MLNDFELESRERIATLNNLEAQTIKTLEDKAQLLQKTEDGNNKTIDPA